MPLLGCVGSAIGIARELVLKPDWREGANLYLAVVGRPGISHYASSKAGLNQLTKVLALELAPHGIAVNAVSPGLISTEQVERLAVASAAEHQTKMSRIPMARMGSPEEMAAAILFLLGEGSSYMTGSVLFADGGYSCGIVSYGGGAK